jgi:hypothetical protein
MTIRRTALQGTLAVCLAIPIVAEARYPRGNRGGYVNTPFGMVNMNSPEWRMSGGNIAVYQQLVQQRMMLQQQRATMKMQQQSMRQARAAGKKQGRRKARANNVQGSGPVSDVTSLSPSGKKRGKASAAETSLKDENE